MSDEYMRVRKDLQAKRKISDEALEQATHDFVMAQGYNYKEQEAKLEELKAEITSLRSTALRLCLEKFAERERFGEIEKEFEAEIQAEETEFEATPTLETAERHLRNVEVRAIKSQRHFEKLDALSEEEQAAETQARRLEQEHERLSTELKTQKQQNQAQLEKLYRTLHSCITVRHRADVAIALHDFNHTIDNLKASLTALANEQFLHKKINGLENLIKYIDEEVERNSEQRDNHYQETLDEQKREKEEQAQWQDEINQIRAGTKDPYSLITIPYRRPQDAYLLSADMYFEQKMHEIRYQIVPRPLTELTTLAIISESINTNSEITIEFATLFAQLPVLKRQRIAIALNEQGLTPNELIPVMQEEVTKAHQQKLEDLKKFVLAI